MHMMHDGDAILMTVSESRDNDIEITLYAAQAANDFRRDLLKYTGPDAGEKCVEHMNIFTGIGGRQDGLVASLRILFFGQHFQYRLARSGRYNPGEGN